MAILNPEADSAATLATGSEAKQRQLAEAGYKHAAIPKHCFERSFVTSTNYMIKNVLTCAALFYAASLIDRTGAAAEVVNNLIGLVLHSALLVPYHSWRLSYRKHHSNTGSCENDEVFVPVTRSVLPSSWNETREDSPLYQLYRIAFMLVVGWMPGYLFFNATGPTKYWGKSRSHFNPNSASTPSRRLRSATPMIVLSDIFLVRLESSSSNSKTSCTSPGRLTIQTSLGVRAFVCGNCSASDTYM
ncbi:hypothetical protein PR002_g25283 [Phytophthora rubi]|uniref:Fatty acid desaturase domain-containing protein n=1 Tax=Phytophthora rubi TaxID=129364 RepID=A0A6A3I136_9STRA|nr:hypothetical protein PR002_g25283 [Phytophthora rubi]